MCRLVTLQAFVKTFLTLLWHEAKHLTQISAKGSSKRRNLLHAFMTGISGRLATAGLI
jgi:hypothetical protein